MAYVKKEDVRTLNRVFDCMTELDAHSILNKKQQLVLEDLKELLDKIEFDNKSFAETAKVNMRKYRASKK